MARGPVRGAAPTLGVDALVVTDLAQLLDAELVQVGIFYVDLLLVFELTHLGVLGLQPVT